MEIDHNNQKINDLEAKLLVGSDGNKSMVKEVRKMGTYGWSYN